MVLSFGFGKGGNGGSSSGGKGGSGSGAKGGGIGSSKGVQTAVIAGKVALGVAAAHNGTASNVDSLQKAYGEGQNATVRSTRARIKW